MRKCPLSKTELQKARRLWEITGENRKARRKARFDALKKPVVVADPLQPLVDAGVVPAIQTKADVLKAKVEKEFADKPRRKAKAAPQADA